MDMQLDWYRIFLQTAKEGNLTKAAHRLYMTQPSVSYAVKRLEQALGVKLFRRQSKGVELTSEGQALYDYVAQSFSLLEAGERKLEELKTLAGGELRIGASDSLFKHFLLPLLGSFRVAYPGIRIRLSHGKTPDIAERVRDGRLDCGIAHLPVEDLQGSLAVAPLFAVESVVVAGDAYKEHADRPLKAAELAGIPLLLLSQGSSSRSYVERWFAAQGISAEADIELGSIELLIEFARLGYGAAFVTRSYVEQELAAGTLAELRTAESLPSRTIGLITRKEMPLSRAAGRFVEMVVQSSAGKDCRDAEACQNAVTDIAEKGRK